MTDRQAPGVVNPKRARQWLCCVCDGHGGCGEQEAPADAAAPSSSIMTPLGRSGGECKPRAERRTPGRASVTEWGVRTPNPGRPDALWLHPADAAVPMLRVVPVGKRRNHRRAAGRLGKQSGKSGRYLRVLHWGSEYGWSLDVWGREWLFVTLSSAKQAAAGWDAITAPLPA